jgi:hypothetical protein
MNLGQQGLTVSRKRCNERNPIAFCGSSGRGITLQGLWPRVSRWTTQHDHLTFTKLTRFSTQRTRQSNTDVTHMSDKCKEVAQ